ncbi:MAG: serine protease [Deltaproteobacteria bacterium]|nr:serine protease [Deltaproteobacteria bacterium]
MPNRSGILDEIYNLGEAQDQVRRSYLAKLAEHTNRDVIIYAAQFSSEGPAWPIELKDVQAFMSAFHDMGNDKLDLILHSPGGYLEAADQIVNYIRSKYNHVRAIIPQNAMSASTMIACSANTIIMGKHSALGPTDPQINGVSAHAILEEFERAKSEIQENPETAPLWVAKIANWPPGFLDMCRREIELSEKKVSQWLNEYMFNGRKPNPAESIAKWLADAPQHRTHGRPLGIDLLKSKGLHMKALEADQEMQDLVLSVFHSTMITFEVSNCVKLVENHKGKAMYFHSAQK